MSFANPLYLILLVLVPLFIYLKLKKSGNKPSGVVAPSLSSDFLEHKSFRSRLVNLPLYLKALAFALLIIAFARPQKNLGKAVKTTDAIDIAISLDVSSSMLAKDFSPDRIGAAKRISKNFVEKRESDRFAFVIFSGESVSQCPLTLDKEAIIRSIDMAQVGGMEDGTAIGMGVASAVNRLKFSEAKSKVIVLLTDGMNNSGAISPQNAAEIAKELGVKIYTIGVGTIGTAPYPVQTDFGVIEREMKVEIDESLLKSIADSTGGKYFRATNDNSLKQIFDEIDKLEKTKVEFSEYTRKREEFQIFVIIALASLIIGFVLENTWLRVLRRS